MNIPLYIESLIFAAQKPITIVEIQEILFKITGDTCKVSDIEQHINQSITKYSSDQYPFEICVFAQGYQFLTKDKYQNVLKQLVLHHSKQKISKSALETLAIIAYKQPVTKREVEKIRGVSCDYTIQKLLSKNLIVIQGKSEAIGKPLIYGTSGSFLDYFGINSLRELPSPKDFAHELNTTKE